MTFSEIIRRLYSNDLSKILSVLNESIYAAESPKGKEELCLHTGFSFINQNSKRFEIIYDSETEKIYRQPKNSVEKLPQVIGLWVARYNSQFFNGHYSQAILEITETGQEENAVLYSFDSLPSASNEEQIYILKAQKNGETSFVEKTNFVMVNSLNGSKLEFPLQKIFNTKIFYNGETNCFSRYVTDEEYRSNLSDKRYDDNEYYEDDEWTPPHSSFYDATDGQLGELGEEGWTSIGRD